MSTTTGQLLRATTTSAAMAHEVLTAGSALAHELKNMADFLHQAPPGPSEAWGLCQHLYHLHQTALELVQHQQLLHQKLLNPSHSIDVHKLKVPHIDRSSVDKLRGSSFLLNGVLRSNNLFDQAYHGTASPPPPLTSPTSPTTSATLCSDSSRRTTRS